LALTGVVACLLLNGCHVSHTERGKTEDVDIGTPFGSMHVNSNDASNLAAIGLPAYPGSVPVREHDGKDQDAADIDMSFGNFHLGVKAASFQTQDPQDKVLAFYRSYMGRYGDVIECRGNTAVGSPARTSQGLTCDQKHHTRVRVSGGNELELRAGSEQHQHIVDLKTKNGGVNIGLVALDLPSHLSGHGRSDVE
jgi:hypothetical protein